MSWCEECGGEHGHAAWCRTADKDWSGKLAAALAETRTLCAQRSDREVTADARATNWKSVAKVYRRIAIQSARRLLDVYRAVSELDGRVSTLESVTGTVKLVGEQLAEALEAIRRPEIPARPDHPAVTAALAAWRALHPKEGA